MMMSTELRPTFYTDEGLLRSILATFFFFKFKRPTKEVGVMSVDVANGFLDGCCAGVPGAPSAYMESRSLMNFQEIGTDHIGYIFPDNCLIDLGIYFC